jgi:hypothetical protein
MKGKFLYKSKTSGDITVVYLGVLRFTYWLTRKQRILNATEVLGKSGLHVFIFFKLHSHLQHSAAAISTV